MKKTLILTILLVSVSALCFSQTWTVSNMAGWIEAVGGIRGGGNNKEYKITVTGNINVPSSSESTFGSVTGITVTIEGSGTLSPSTNGSLLVIGKDQTVIAKDLTLKGRDANNNVAVRINEKGTFHMEGKASVTGNKTSGRGAGGVYIYGGTFTMKDNASVSGNTIEKGTGGVYAGDRSIFTMQDNASVSGNTGNDSGDGGGITVYHGTFTMKDDASIMGNKNTGGNGGGVQVLDGTFIMSGGTISGNTASGSGGGVSVDIYYNNKSGTFTMQSGTISGNTAREKGGGVYIGKNITFTMQDSALISGNAANNGGGVYISNKGGADSYNGNFTMNDGTISGNTATSNGGGVLVEGTFTMNNGTISGNIGAIGGGVYFNYGDFTMQGGTIWGNTASLGGGGVYFSAIFAKTAKTGGTIYGDDAEQKLKNTAISGMGHAVANNDRWRNAGAGQTMNLDSYGFWLSEGDLVMFSSDFAGIWKRNNFNNTLTVAGNAMKTSSSNYVWVLQRVSGNAYTLKRADTANTMTLTIRFTEGSGRYDPDTLVISGDSGSGENNWNGTWRKQ